MRRWFSTGCAVIGLAGLLMIVAPGAAAACSCAAVPFAERLADFRVAVLFSGTATGGGDTTAVTRSDEPVPWTFAVDTVHRGAVTRTATVWTAADGASCGIDFVVGRRYLVIAGVDERGAASASLCGGTIEVERLTADQRVLLGVGTAPGPDPVAAPPAATASRWSGPLPWVAVASLAAGSVAVTVGRRLLRRP